MEEINITAAIEAILFSNGDSVEKSRIAQALEIPEKLVDESRKAAASEFARPEMLSATLLMLKTTCLYRNYVRL